MSATEQSLPRLDPRKFRDPARTADGEPRARVALRSLDTLWFNTGTLCNLTCRGCYIESSPRNDALATATPADVSAARRIRATAVTCAVGSRATCRAPHRWGSRFRRRSTRRSRARLPSPRSPRRWGSPSRRS